MKRFYFSKANFGNEYFLDFGGAYGKKRKVIGSDEELIIRYFKKNIEEKRKSELVVFKGSINEKFLEKILELFEKTNVKIRLEDSFD